MQSTFLANEKASFSLPAAGFLTYIERTAVTHFRLRHHLSLVFTFLIELLLWQPLLQGN
jgi:hypothetical protein